MSAGELKFRFAFAKREATNDGYGNTEGSWVDQFEVAAGLKPLKGGEAVLAARLSGAQPVIIRVRYSQQALLIKTGWQARNAATGEMYNITSNADMEGKRQYLDIMATAGVAVG